MRCEKATWKSPPKIGNRITDKSAPPDEQSPRLRGQEGVQIEHVYADAKRVGVSRLHWLTHESNHDGMRLYDRIADRAGFIQYRKQFA